MIAQERVGWCRYIQMIQDLTHTRHPATHYRTDPQRMCVCEKHGYESKIESTDAQGVIEAFKQSYCGIAPIAIRRGERVGVRDIGLASPTTNLHFSRLPAASTRIGHIDRRTQEGSSRLHALLYACHPRLVNGYLACERCNAFKGTDLSGIDLDTGQVEPCLTREPKIGRITSSCAGP